MLENPFNYQVLELTKFAQVRRYWSYFRESLGKLNELCDEQVTEETFLRATLDAMNNGIVFIITRKGEGTPLTMAVVMKNLNPYRPPALSIYATYSTGDASVVAYGLRWLEEWAREHGFRELQAESPRINGSAFYLFEKKWGFRRRSVYFTKQL